MNRLNFLINCDLGEGSDNDAQLMPYLDACNIACGGHAGNEATMNDTVRLAMSFGVQVGAHPSFPDLKNFGRKHVEMPDELLKSSLKSQVSDLMAICKSNGCRMGHIKLHGALYNQAAKDAHTANLVLQALAHFHLPFFAPQHSIFSQVASKRNIDIVPEAFADRRYADDLSLLPRHHPAAVINDSEKCLEQLKRIIETETVQTISNLSVPLKAETFCVHGDTPNALEILKTLNDARYD